MEKIKLKPARSKSSYFLFFSEKEGEELRAEGYVGKLKIIYPQSVDSERGNK